MTTEELKSIKAKSGRGYLIINMEIFAYYFSSYYFVSCKSDADKLQIGQKPLLKFKHLMNLYRKQFQSLEVYDAKEVIEVVLQQIGR